MNSYKKGHWAEIVAAIFLTLKGYRILRRRYHSPRGEVDLIARKGSLIIGIEVKARATTHRGLEAITGKQKQRIIRGLQHYIHRSRWKPKGIRLDAIILTPQKWPIHFKDAWRERSPL